MNKILIIAVLAFVAVFIWLGYDAQLALEQCKAAGVQSNETCEAYAR